MKFGTLIASGNTADVCHFDEKKIIKVFKRHFPESEAFKEMKKQKIALACGLRVPEIYDVTEVNGCQAIVMEYIKGRSLGESILHQTESIEKMMIQCVEVQQSIHQITVKNRYIEPMNEKLIHQINDSKLLNEQQRECLIDRMKRIDYQAHLCHGDFHPFNVMINDETDEITIIDWVDASAGDVRADVYRTYLLFSNSSQKLADIYLRLYCSTSTITKEEVLQWAPIIAGARLSENIDCENTERLLDIVKAYCG